MGKPRAPLGPETIRFFRDLGRHNRKEWMDANRERYRAEVVAPMRALLEALAPAALRLNPAFETSGRTGTNFSRINRDTRFADDKTPYRTQMYLTFPDPHEGEERNAQLYVGVAADAVTAGFRTYSGGSAKRSPLTQTVLPRVAAHPQWLARQKMRLSRRYESYWYSVEKGEWTKRNGWPLSAEEWKKVKGWIVRKKFTTAAATRASFLREAARVFRDVFPLLEFTTSPSWKG